jgi:hypothetical protein
MITKQTVEAAEVMEGRDLVGPREIQLSLARCHRLFFED